MVKGMLQLLSNCPSETAHLRKELLIAAKHILTTDLRSRMYIYVYIHKHTNAFKLLKYESEKDMSFLIQVHIYSHIFLFFIFTLFFSLAKAEEVFRLIVVLCVLPGQNISSCI